MVLAARDGPCEDCWGLGSIVVNENRIDWAEFYFLQMLMGKGEGLDSVSKIFNGGIVLQGCLSPLLGPEWLGSMLIVRNLVALSPSEVVG